MVKKIEKSGGQRRRANNLLPHAPARLAAPSFLFLFASKVCLFGNTEVSLRDALRSGMPDSEVRRTACFYYSFIVTLIITLILFFGPAVFRLSSPHCLFYLTVSGTNIVFFYKESIVAG